jgi:23S rRNA (cytosine1962-C5)-methyltransferase
MSIPEVMLCAAAGWKEYELLDSGNGAKLERFGTYTFVRPEHQAVWSPLLPKTQWDAAHAVFEAVGGEETGGRWLTRRAVPAEWTMHYRNLVFQARFSASRHLGVFPEQAVQWDWMQTQLSAAGGSAPKVLNLFGYSGLASLAAAAAGAQVTHVDAAKKSVTWARENLEMSGLGDRPVRWIVDDALKFVQREARRGAWYDGIIMDPPKFGRGPKGEVWEVFELLPTLLSAARQILAPQPLFFIITAYAIRASALSLYYALDEALAGLEGEMRCGEILTSASSGARSLSHAIFARWRGRRTDAHGAPSWPAQEETS